MEHANMVDAEHFRTIARYLEEQGWIADTDADYGVFRVTASGIAEVLKELDVAEELVNTFDVRAKRYWMGWGPVVGMPMILTIEAWTEGQRQYLNKWLRPRILEL